MKPRIKRILGIVCLAYSGVFLLLLMAVTLVPSVAKVANRTWEDHAVSLGLLYLTSALGVYLVRKEPKPGTARHLMLFVLLWTPLILLKGHSMVGQTEVRPELVPWIRAALIVLSAISVSVPYLFGSRILKGLKAKPPSSTVTPVQALHFIGMLFSLMPAAIGECLSWLGESRSAVLYSVAFSYIAGAVWWLWWNHRYSREPEG